jgi:predicted alpha/beta superfamily hydrolase
VSVNLYLHRRALTRLLVAVGGTLAIPAIAGPIESQGRIDRLSSIGGPGVAPREIEVWLPPTFDRDGRYAVVYMHDGQMLFDPNRTWNRQAWEIDRAATQLLASGEVRDFIIVGIHNDPARRHAEFFPQAALQYLGPGMIHDTFVERALGGRPASDDYLRFIVDVVKPEIDSRYPTAVEKHSTFIMGSSMGGLISLYAVGQYPQIFGGAAALSTHWIGTYERNNEIPAALVAYLRTALPPPSSTRIYMDRGTTELDALYDTAQSNVDELMHDLGYQSPNFVSRIVDGAGHNEKAWAARAREPLKFLLRP